MIIILSLLLGGIFLITFAPTKVFADDSHIVINELYPYPNTGESEWIELYNPTDQIVDLSECSLSDQNIDDNDKAPYKFSKGDSINRQGYFVIDSDKLNFILNNTSDHVTLSCGGVVDQVTYGETGNSAEKPSQGKSITRSPEGFDSDSNNTDFIEALPSNGIPYLRPTYPKNVIITEILPTPENGVENEFIEILNKGTAELSLDGWMIDDSEGGSSPFRLSGMMQPAQYNVFYNGQTHIALNDTGDTARLIDPNGEVVSSVSYNEAIRGQSYNYVGDSWSWSLVNTPGQENILSNLNLANPAETNLTTDITDIAFIRQLENGKEVTIEGTVTATPESISGNFFYIQDETGGLQIYSYRKEFPILATGDRLRVKGELSSVSNERRLKIRSLEDIIILATGLASQIQPSGVKINQIDESREGTLIEVTGKVIKSSGSQFWISDETGSQIRVDIKKNAVVGKPKLRKGDIVEVQGIVSQYKEEYRILPFESGSVRIMSSDHLPKAGGNELIVLAIGFANHCILWKLLQKVKKRLSRSGRLSPVLSREAIS